MGKMDQGFTNLLAEATRLIAGALEEKMEDGELWKKLVDVNQRMADEYGRVISVIAINLEIATEPMPGGEEKEEKPELSLRFGFGGSEEDREMEKKFGLDGQEMNQLLEEARKEGKRIGGEGSDTKTASPPPEAETSNLCDPRNISQIINSIRGTARTLNLKQRMVLVDTIRKAGMFKRQNVVITLEQMKNDTAWLQSVQSIINGIRDLTERGVGDPEAREEFLKQALSFLEKSFEDARTP